MEGINRVMNNQIMNTNESNYSDSHTIVYFSQNDQLKFDSWSTIRSDFMIMRKLLL